MRTRDAAILAQPTEESDGLQSLAQSYTNKEKKQQKHTQNRKTKDQKETHKRGRLPDRTAAAAAAARSNEPISSARIGDPP